MAKAILELEMPEKCFDCSFTRFIKSLNTKTGKDGGFYLCIAHPNKIDITQYYDVFCNERHPDCPLKLVEDKEVELRDVER